MAKSFAQGGFVYKDVPVHPGENPNSKFDPEMVAPYSKVSKAMHESIRQSFKEPRLPLVAPKQDYSLIMGALFFAGIVVGIGIAYIIGMIGLN